MLAKKFIAVMEEWNNGLYGGEDLSMIKQKEHWKEL